MYTKKEKKNEKISIPNVETRKRHTEKSQFERKFEGASLLGAAAASTNRSNQWKDDQTESLKRTDGRMDRRTDRRKYGWVGGQIDGRTD